ncbi:MAG: DUF4132 domain-containing protein [Bradymonadia bacterium]
MSALKHDVQRWLNIVFPQPGPDQPPWYGDQTFPEETETSQKWPAELWWPAVLEEALAHPHGLMLTPLAPALDGATPVQRLALVDRYRPGVRPVAIWSGWAEELALFEALLDGLTPKDAEHARPMVDAAMMRPIERETAYAGGGTFTEKLGHFNELLWAAVCVQVGLLEHVLPLWQRPHVEDHHLPEAIVCAEALKVRIITAMPEADRPTLLTDHNPLPFTGVALAPTAEVLEKMLGALGFITPAYDHAPKWMAAMVSLGPMLRPALIKALKVLPRYAPGRLMLITALGEVTPLEAADEVFPTLKQIIDSGETKHRGAALEVWGRLGGDPQVLLGQLLCTSKILQEGAQAGLAAHPHPKTARTALLPNLHGLLTERKKVYREGAARALTVLPGPDSQGPLETALAKERSAGTATLLAQALAACLPGLENMDPDKLDEALSQRSPTKVPALADPEGLPTLTWRHGQVMSAGALRWLLDRALSDTAMEDPDLPWVIGHLPEGTSEALCHAITLRASTSTHADEARSLRVMAILGAEAQIMKLGQGLEKRVKTPSFSKALKALADHARLRRGGPAVYWLDHWSRHAKRPRIRRQVGETLTALCADLQRDADDLIDEGIPRFGFDTEGLQHWPISEADVIELRLAEDLSLSMSRKGKTIKSLPKAAPEAMRARLKILKAGLKKVGPMVIERLALSACADRRWSATTWKALCIHHPITRALARNLVFESGRSGTPGTVFDSMGVFTLDALADDLTDETWVRLAHPIDLDEARRSRWLAWESARRTPFPLMTRLVVEGTQVEAMKARIRTEGQKVWRRDLRKRIEREGYRSGAIADRGLIWTAVRDLGALGKIVIAHEGYPFERDYEGEPVGFTDVWVVLGPKVEDRAGVSRKLTSEGLKDAAHIFAVLL